MPCLTCQLSLNAQIIFFTYKTNEQNQKTAEVQNFKHDIHAGESEME